MQSPPLLTKMAALDVSVPIPNKRRSIWDARTGDQVQSSAKAHYNARGEIIAFLSGGRAEVRLRSGQVALIPLPDLDLLNP